jgi:RNA-directed DNA polymerase
MAEGGSIGRWPVVGDEAGYTAGISCFTAARQRVLALPLRLWADVWRKKVAKGDVVVVRFADDLVVSFQHRTEAERFLKDRIDGR